MTSPQPTGPSPQATTLRVLAFALGTAPLLIVVVLCFVLPPTTDDQPPVAVVLGLLTLVLASVLVAETVGFMTLPLDDASASVADVQRESLDRFQSSMLLRFSIAEMPLLVALAVSFVLDHGAWPLLTTSAAAIPVLWFELWPGRRNAAKLAGRLESRGVRSWLPEALGVG